MGKICFRILRSADRARRLLDIIGELIADVASYIQSRTRSYSIAVNRMAARITPSPFLHGNCSVQMISPDSYREMQLPIEQRLAAKLQPYGITTAEAICI